MDNDIKKERITNGYLFEWLIVFIIIYSVESLEMLIDGIWLLLIKKLVFNNELVLRRLWYSEL